MTNYSNSTLIIKALKFQHKLIIDPTNYCEGMWILWNENNVKVTNSHSLIDVHTAHLTVYHKQTNKLVLITSAYCPAQENRKDSFSVH